MGITGDHRMDFIAFFFLTVWLANVVKRTVLVVASVTVLTGVCEPTILTELAACIEHTKVLHTAGSLL